MSLIGHWRAADESGGVIPDLSGGGLNGTLTAGCSAITLDDGEAAIRCPGGSDCVEVSDDAKWNLADFTMLCRFARPDYTSLAPLITHTPGAGLVDKWLFAYLEGSVVAGLPSLALQGRAPAGFQVVSNPYSCAYNMPVTAWVKRAGTTVTFGVNDATIGTATFGTVFTDVAQPLRFGSGQEITFNGAVDIIAVRIYDAALSDTDIQTAWLADAPPQLPAPSASTQIGRWRAYDDESGGPVVPSRLDGIPDAVVGALCSWVDVDDCPAVLCLGTGPSGPVTPVPAGITEQSRCLVVAHDPRWRLDPGDFTLITRADFVEIIHIQGLAGHNEGTDGNNVSPMWSFYVDNNGALPLRARLAITWVERNAANVRHTVTSDNIDIGDFVAAGLWGLAVVRSGDDFSFYAWNDGAFPFALISTETESGAFPDDIVAPLYIGRGGNQSHDGTDQDQASFRMFNYALDAAAVEAAMLEDTLCTRPPQAKARVLADCGDPIFVNPCPDPDAP